jgi:hypothetical protein
VSVLSVVLRRVWMFLMDKLNSVMIVLCSGLLLLVLFV